MFSSILNKYLALFSVDSLVSTVGQDFIFGFVNNYDGSGLLVALVSNANDQPANVTITSSFASFQTISVLVQPQTVEKVDDIEYKYEKQLTDSHYSADNRCSLQRHCRFANTGRREQGNTSSINAACRRLCTQRNFDWCKVV